MGVVGALVVTVGLPATVVAVVVAAAAAFWALVVILCLVGLSKCTCSGGYCAEEACDYRVKSLLVASRARGFPCQ